MSFDFVDEARGGGVEPLPLDLEFVNLNVSSEAERQMNKRIIRSTAMKNFRRKQRPRQTPADTGTVNGKSRTKSKTSPVIPISDTRRASVVSSLPEKPSGGGSLTTSPGSILGAGRIDPFRIQPIDIGSRGVELLDHCRLPRVNFG